MEGRGKIFLIHFFVKNPHFSLKHAVRIYLSSNHSLCNLITTLSQVAHYLCSPNQDKLTTVWFNTFSVNISNMVSKLYFSVNVYSDVPVVSRLLWEAESLSGLQMTVPWESEEKWEAIDSWWEWECECL